MCFIVALFKKKKHISSMKKTFRNRPHNFKGVMFVDTCAKFQINPSKSIQTGTSKRRSIMRILKAEKIGSKDVRRPADLCWHKQLICQQECHIRRIGCKKQHSVWCNRIQLSLVKIATSDKFCCRICPSTNQELLTRRRHC